eukprot:TRINITY_DN18385_c0_g1_i1.p1 TRINITY_DN18385_c0_g1~~TRINITY_DN18385_c0_g1_i1.p1  ORF type:complete len:377 (+),score=50.49 TRINITY_DN18385_c0_g1_i1:106-1131(+)
MCIRDREKPEKMACVAFLLVLLIHAVSAGSGPHPVACHTVNIPNLTAVLPTYRSARTCYPSTPNLTFSTHLLIHGDAGGGPFGFAYHGLQEQIASFGFVVPFFSSCFVDQECHNGESYFVEAARTLRYFENHPDEAPINFELPYSVSGHSTGARAALMIAAIVDTPEYLMNTSFAADLTVELRTTLSKVKAVIADHPDPMYDPKQNPDIPHWRITQTPVLIITGSEDKIEPTESAWRDFMTIQAPNKVFIDIHGASHLQPIEAHPEGPYLAYFSQLYALGDLSVSDLIYGNQSGSLSNSGVAHFSVATQEDPNMGANSTVGFLGCRASGAAVPAHFAQFCH